jgi:hypothetical protein
MRPYIFWIEFSINDRLPNQKKMTGGCITKSVGLASGHLREWGYFCYSDVATQPNGYRDRYVGDCALITGATWRYSTDS